MTVGCGFAVAVVDHYVVSVASSAAAGAGFAPVMGTAVVGGMLISTFFTMYIVPAIYSYISTDRKTQKKKE